ncbi:[NiFe] hydrogenase nickel incorporation-associated protein HypB [Campylobacter jejuni subsp. doylei]|nr:[NiFe] hydrogenase nickel incorporation-associated protein HypB [Campylobacter jejuni subsp. doylei]
MCKDCGCSINSTHTHDHHDHHHENPSLKESKTIEVISKILSKNDEEAKHIERILMKLARFVSI